MNGAWLFVIGLLLCLGLAYHPKWFYERRHRREHQQWIDECNNRQPRPVGPDIICQSVQTEYRDDHGRLILGRKAVGYRYFQDGVEIPGPNERTQTT